MKHVITTLNIIEQCKNEQWITSNKINQKDLYKQNTRLKIPNERKKIY